MTDMSTGMIEVCRRACGGHGFLMCSGIAENMASSLAFVTIEGENTVLYLQTARYVTVEGENTVLYLQTAR